MNSFVESGCDAVTLGSGCLLPPLSSGGAEVPSPSLQEVERPFRDRADSRLLLVDRQLQSPHELAHPGQRRIGIAPPAQDHEIICIGHAATVALCLYKLYNLQHVPQALLLDNCPLVDGPATRISMRQKIEANLKDGVLTVRIPKRTDFRPRKIEVQ
jgi:hypothetical protein